MSRIVRPLLLPAFFLFLTAMASAEGTKQWEQTRFDDFEKGTAKGVAISSDGTLSVAPAFKSLFTSPSTYTWAIVSDAEGTAYMATGAPARVYRVTPDGKASVIFEAKELQVQALVIDPNGVLYAATAPDGKVFKIEKGTPGASAAAAAKEQRPAKSGEKSSAEASAEVPVDSSYKSTVFFDPKTKYIWALVLDNATGRLYVATGDQGEIYKVEKDGAGSLFFKSDEAHIRSLALAPATAGGGPTKGQVRGSSQGSNLIAGSDGSGLIYRITPAGEGFVLYSAAKKEITALAVDDGGTIYAAGVGDKRTSGSGAVPFTMQTQGQANPGGNQPQVVGQPAPAHAGGSEVYAIAPDGAPQRIWESKDDLVYALAFDGQGRLLVGTGNRGRIYAMDKPAHPGTFTDLLKASANQVTSFAVRKGGGLYASTSNLGKLFAISNAPETDATYESDVFDAHVFSKWGRAEVRSSGALEFFARSGNVDNPDRNWSPWNKVDLQKDATIGVPPARFLQWRVALHGGSDSGRVESVRINYRSRNVAPVIDDIAVQVGARFNITPPPRGTPETIMIPLGPQPNTIGSSGPSTPGPLPAVHDKGSIAVRWSAHDDNDDDLIFSVYYKGDRETQWKLLKADLDDKQYSWDASLFPDGGYEVRIVASDAPSHTPDEALTDEKISQRFEVDTTPPRIDSLQARTEAGVVHVTFRAVDSFSPVSRAEYSIDAGDWQFVEPVGQLSDQLTENYDFNIPLPATTAQPAATEPEQPGKTKGRKSTVQANPTGEHTIVVRVYDRFDNQVSAKTVTNASSK